MEKRRSDPPACGYPSGYPVGVELQAASTRLVILPFELDTDCENEGLAPLRTGPVRCYSEETDPAGLVVVTTQVQSSLNTR